VTCGEQVSRVALGLLRRVWQGEKDEMSQGDVVAAGAGLSQPAYRAGVLRGEMVDSAEELQRGFIEAMARAGN
jgi:hypothetical protein